MSLIIYSNSNSNSQNNSNSYGIKQISESIFKKLMYNEFHKQSRFLIPKSKIETEFETNINIEKEELDVILMTELNESQLKTYLETYEDDEIDNLNKYLEFLSVIKYYQIYPEKFKIKKKLDFLLNSISFYWEDPSNCNFNLTQKFIDRRFNNCNYVNNKNNNNNNNEIIHKTLLNSNNNSKLSNLKINSHEMNYLNGLLRENNWTDFTLKNYNLSKISSLSYSDVLIIYNQLPTEYMKYNFICNMLCSRSHCHLILNSRELLEQSKPIFDKYKIVFKYLIGYSWLTLKNEEYHIYCRMKDSDRIVFDIDTANLLPVFPFTWDDLNQNPYACVLIDETILNLKKNCLSMNMMRNYNQYYGVCSSKEFSRRLNIFVNGTNVKGILDQIDWSCCAVTGSAMTACGMKYNPLMDICKLSNNPTELADEDLSSFFFHYYEQSDVDLICNKESIIDFIDTVQKLVEKYPKEKTTVDDIHTGSIVISDEFIAGEIEKMRKVLKNNNIDVEYVKKNYDSQDIKNYFYDKFYVPWKIEQFKKIKNLNKHTEELIKKYLKAIPRDEFRIYDMVYDINEENMIGKDFEKYYFSNNENNKNNKNKLIAKLSESIRYKIKCQGIKTFEIFKSRNENFFSIVSRFHMGFVRAFWNGHTVKCLPSYITSMMLQLAVDYKYFSSVRSPVEIVNKFRSRGFGSILNDHEKVIMAHYNSTKGDNFDEKSKWLEMYKIDIKDKKSIENIFGAKKSSDDIFKPSKFFMNLHQDCFKNINHDTVTTFDECFSSIITPSVSSMSKCKAINNNGKINPLSKEVINLGWNLINSNLNSKSNSKLNFFVFNQT